MKLVYKNRLLKLADYLAKEVKRDNFDMSSICYWDGTTDDEYSDLVWNPQTQKLTPFDCGATACAIGHCPFVFPKLNLKFDFNNGYICGKSGKVWNSSKWFGITHQQWIWLFDAVDPTTNDDREDETPQQVAKRIMKFVKEDGKVPEDMYY